MYAFCKIIILVSLFIVGCDSRSDLLKRGVAPKMVFVRGGSFVMQRVDLEGELSGRARPTTVGDFYIGKFSVTYGEWSNVCEWANDNGYDLESVGNGCRDSHPVYDINWYDAVKWCNALSEMTGLTPVYYVQDQDNREVYRQGKHDINNDDVDWSGDGYRIPTEAEWEFAARGGNHSMGYLFSGSDKLDEVGWYGENSTGAECDLTWSGTGQGTWPVGAKLRNELGIHDMSGNVREWCWDWFWVYGDDAVENPRGPDARVLDVPRIVRGGSWADAINTCNVRSRHSEDPSFRELTFTGIRLTQTAKGR